MPDVNLTGRIVDENGAGVSGVIAELVQFKPIWGRTPSGAPATSDSTGQYTITTSDSGSSFHIKFKSPVNRLLAQTDLFQISKDPISVPTVTIPQNTITGWLITNLDPSGQVSLLSTNNAVTFLVDDASAWKELADAVKRANVEINFQILWQLITKPPVLLVFTPDPPTEGVKTSGLELEYLLASASSSAPPVTVRYVLWDAQAPVPWEFGKVSEVENYFKDPATLPNTVEVRGFATNYTTPMHAKFITIDSAEAHILGSPIDQKYFDSQAHMIREARRGKLSGGGITKPIHDCGMKLVGPAVEDLRKTFFLHWNNIPGKPKVDPIPKMPTPAPSGGNVSVQIARTLPGDARYPTIPRGETGMLEAYLRAYFQATDYVYMETQYLLSQDLTAGIRLALKRTPSLQFILVLNNEPDLYWYPTTQNLRIRQLFDAASKDGTRSRLGLFTLWKHEQGTPLNQIIGVYVHAKAAVIDDKWAAVGSSNLDGTSMDMTDWYSTLDIPPIPTEIVRESDEHHRSVEVNAVIFDSVGGQPANGMAEVLRRKLWAEHLGLQEGSSILDAANRPAGGWLDLWRSKANAFKAALNAAPPDLSEQARVLEWNPNTDDEKYLLNAGVSKVASRFNVLRRYPSFSFTTGKFL